MLIKSSSLLPVQSLTQSAGIMGSRDDMSDMTRPRNVLSSFNYYPRPVEEGPQAPFTVNSDSYAESLLAKEAVVHNLRGSEDEYRFDTAGFQVFNHISCEKEFLDDEKIKEVYYPEMETLFKQATGASKIIVYGHVLRRHAYDFLYKKAAATRFNRDLLPNGAVKPIPKYLLGPLHTVHVDHSYDGAAMVIRQRLGSDQAAHLLAKRHQILVGWRPIKTILRDPFAVCDARSVLEEELVPIKLIYPNQEAESFSIRPPLEYRTDDGHKWYYLHKQTPEEVLIFKIFDSKTSVSRRVPHSAFVDKEYEKEDPRASLDIRALVFYDEDIA